MWSETAMDNTNSGRTLDQPLAAPLRFALAALAILTPAAVVFAALIGWQVNKLLAERTLDALRFEVQTFRGELDRGGISALAEAIGARSAAPGKGLYYLRVPDGAKWIDVGNLQSFPSGISEAGDIFQIWNAVDADYHAAAGIVLPVPGGGKLLVARDIEDQRSFASNLQRLAFIGVGLLAAVALGLGLTANRRSVRRIADITQTARSIMDGDFSRRMPRDGSDDEFDHLASGLNEMLSRIEELMQALREVSDNIAHDLKTPLTRLRNRAEAALRDDHPAAHRDGLEKVIEEADGLIQTFNALLLIARLEAGAVDATQTPCDIAALVRDVAELYQPVADEAGLSIEISGETAVVLSVNRQLVGQAVANMIDNAIKYSAGVSVPPAGPVMISVLRRSEGSVEISVTDKGPGIAAADRERATKRFVRLEQSRSRPGTGLGLSLVAAVARLHGGLVRLDDNAPGLRIVLRLGDPARSTARTSAAGELDGAAQPASAVG